MRVLMLALVVGSLFISSSYVLALARKNRGPKHGGIIGVGYYLCRKCNSAEGGIYGKGPYKKFRSSDALKCVHKWEIIEKQEFLEFCARQYGIDWKKEIPFWSGNN